MSTRQQTTDEQLARNLVEQYHGAAAAHDAEEKFRQVVQRREAPAEVPAITVPAALQGATWIELCAHFSLSKSKSETKRLMKQGGFYVDQQPEKDIEAVVSIPDDGVLIRLGKRRYYQLVKGD